MQIQFKTSKVGCCGHSDCSPSVEQVHFCIQMDIATQWSESIDNSINSGERLHVKLGRRQTVAPHTVPSWSSESFPPPRLVLETVVPLDYFCTTELMQYEYQADIGAAKSFPNP